MAFISVSSAPFSFAVGSKAASSTLLTRSASQVRKPSRVNQSRQIILASVKSESETKAAASSDVPFEVRGFSLANFGTVLGLAVTGYSFYGYFSSNGTASGTSLGFVYGVPILLIGLALKYAELKPVPVTSASDARAARETKATAIQTKIIKDVTRHRYGDEAHLDTALKALGLIPRGGSCPRLLRLTETMDDGKYVLGLEFFSKETPYATWEQQQEKYDRFFGPNVSCSVDKISEEKRIVMLNIKSLQ